MRKADKLSPEAQKQILIGLLLMVLLMIVVGIVWYSGKIIPFLTLVFVGLIIFWRVQHYRKLIPSLRAERKELDDRFRARQDALGLDEMDKLEPIPVPWWLLAFRYSQVKDQVVFYAYRFHWIDLIAMRRKYERVPVKGDDENTVLVQIEPYKRFTAFSLGLILGALLGFLLYRGIVLPWWVYVAWMVFVAMSLVRWLSYWLVLTDKKLKVVRAIRFGLGSQDDADLTQILGSSADDTPIGNTLGYKNIGKFTIGLFGGSFARHLRFVRKSDELDTMIRKLKQRGPSLF